MLPDKAHEEILDLMEGRMEAEEEGERVAGVSDMEEEEKTEAEAWDAEEEGDWMERDSDEDWG